MPRHQNPISGLTNNVRRWFRRDIIGLMGEMRWSYVPPLMVYFAAGVSGFTGIIESFFVKEELGLSAAFLAGLGFWAGLPWALKMPVGHLVDLFWRWKAGFVYLGAALMGASLLIMVGLTGYTAQMAALLPLDTWYVLAVLLAPVGYVLQDVVADAMTVEAVPTLRVDGTPFPEEQLKQMHVTMQTLGRVAIIGGGAVVAGSGGWLAATLSYASMYRIALVIPLISVAGVLLAAGMRWRARRCSGAFAAPPVSRSDVRVNPQILWGSAGFVAVSLLVGLSGLPHKEEMIFIGSLGVILYLMRQVLADLAPEKRREIVAIAIIVFVFRAMPTAGAGASWWQIDALGFDEAFFGTLRQISALLTIAGMLALRSWMGRHSLPYIVVFLAIYSAFMMLPFIAMFYGLHQWTAAHLGFGPRTIAMIDTMADAPMGQVAMIPMLAWIAREAPAHQKATYFAVMAAFTNLALSASQLGTRYLNEIFVIERGQYAALGHLLITVALLALVVPIIAAILFRPRRPPRMAGDCALPMGNPVQT